MKREDKSSMKRSQACAAYLKSIDGLERMLRAMRRKYEALGQVGGNVVLKNPTKSECLFLRGLLRKDYTGRKQITLSLKAFEAGFQETPYAGMTLPLTLEAYFDEVLETNKEKEARLASEKEQFFSRLFQSLTEASLTTWIKKTLASPGSGASQWLGGLYGEDPQGLMMTMVGLDHLLLALQKEDRLWSRPHLAAAVTKDPHALDDGSLLLQALLYHLTAVMEVKMPRNAEERAGLLSEVGIVVEGLTMTVPTYGLWAKDKEGPKGWHRFYELKEPLVLTPYNLKGIEELGTLAGGPVFCFENPAVFDALIREHPQVAALCTSGQLHQAALSLLKLLENSQVPVIYSGDYDPEGLLIAQRLLDRFHNVRLGLYDVDLYKAVHSEKEISSRRLAALRHIEDPSLRAVAQAMIKKRRAGYQEYMMEAILEDCRARHQGASWVERKCRS